MDSSIRMGLGFGLTSGIIGTLGLMVGLHASTKSTLVVIGGILSLAISEGLSEAASMHIAEECKNNSTMKDVWQATLSTLLSKFLFSSIFIIPVILFNTNKAILLSIMYGLFGLFIISLINARERDIPPLILIFKNLGIAIFVIIITHFMGIWLYSIFG